MSPNTAARDAAGPVAPTTRPEGSHVQSERAPSVADGAAIAKPLSPLAKVPASATRKRKPCPCRRCIYQRAYLKRKRDEAARANRRFMARPKAQRMAMMAVWAAKWRREEGWPA